MVEQPNNEQVFRAIPASPGIGRAPLFLYLQGDFEVPRYAIAAERLEEEIGRFELALMDTRKQISAIRAEVEEKVGEEEAAIFDAHQLVLEDRALIEDTIKEVVDSGMNIEFCLQQVTNRYLEAFAQIDDEYIKERAGDIRDVTKRLVANLLGLSANAADHAPDCDYVIATRDLTPSDTAVLNIGKVKGIISETGSYTSHSVIMARSLNIAAVVGLHGFLDKVHSGDEVLVDGYKGLVYLNPSSDTLRRYGKVESEKRFIWEHYEAERQLAAEMADGTNCPLLLNVEGIEAEEPLRNSGACGVGLLRTENLFLSAKGFPDEESQFNSYRRLVEWMAPHPVTIRTMDLGGDKNPQLSLTGYTEANPFMGFRAIRYCLEFPDVFKVQLRAILRASAFGKVKILYPMICNLDEIRRSNELLELAMEELRTEGIAFDAQMPRGAMIEVPSAAVIVDLIARHVDFLSIGTNDLVQYLLAVDRVNDRISYLYDAMQPAVMRTLHYIFKQGAIHHVPVNVCGELAGDPLFAPLLIGMGANDLSLSVGQLPPVKYLLRRLRLEDARSLATAVLACTEAAQIRSHMESFHDQILHPLFDQARSNRSH